MTATHYPLTFYIVHKLFTDDPFKPGGEWGTITDGPLDGVQMMEEVIDAYRDEEPTRENMRVWLITIEGNAHDMTNMTIEDYHKRMEKLG